MSKTKVGKFKGDKKRMKELEFMLKYLYTIIGMLELEYVEVVKKISVK